MKKITLLILCFFNMQFVQGQQVVDLASILSDIETNHPELQMYMEKAKAFDTYAKGAKSWEAPQVSAGLWMTPYNASLWKADPNSYKAPLGSGAFMISGTQMIPNFKRLKANENYMKEMSSVEKANQGFTRNQLFYEAKMNYYDWLVLKRKMQVLKNNESLANFIIKSAEARYPYNKEKLGTIYKAKASLLELNNEQILTENEIEQKRTALNILLNRDKSTFFDIDTTYKIEDYDLQKIDTSQIVTSRSDINSIERAIKVNRLKQIVEKSKGGFTYGINFSHMQSFGIQPNLFTVMAMMTIPIAPWSSGEYKANVAGLNFDIMAMERQKEVIINQTSGVLQSLAKQISNKKRQVKLYETGIIKALQNNYKASLLAFEQNTEDLFVLLDARQNMQMAQMEYLNQLGELLSLQVQYEKEIEK